MRPSVRLCRLLRGLIRFERRGIGNMGKEGKEGGGGGKCIAYGLRLRFDVSVKGRGCAYDGKKVGKM